MSEFTSATPIKAVRKAHRCYWCPEPIPEATGAVRVVGVWDGNFSVFYVHPECDEAWQRDPCNDEDEGCIYRHVRGQTCAEVDEEPPMHQQG